MATTTKHTTTRETTADAIRRQLDEIFEAEKEKPEAGAQQDPRYFNEPRLERAYAEQHVEESITGPFDNLTAKGKDLFGLLVDYELGFANEGTGTTPEEACYLMLDWWEAEGEVLEPEIAGTITVDFETPLTFDTDDAFSAGDIVQALDACEFTDWDDLCARALDENDVPPVYEFTANGERYGVWLALDDPRDNRYCVPPFRVWTLEGKYEEIGVDAWIYAQAL